MDLRICMGLPSPLVSRVQKEHSGLPTTIVIRRDVRRLVVLIPVEDQQKHDKSSTTVTQETGLFS